MGSTLVRIMALLLLSFQVFAQVKVHSDREDWQKEIEALGLDSLNPAQVRLALQNEGFWLHRWEDSILYSGPRLEIGSLELDSLERLDAEKNLKLNAENWSKLLGKTLESYANKGFPFASLELKNYRIEDQKLYARGQIDAGPFIRFDSLVVLGYQEVDPRLLTYEIDWQVGLAYSEEYLKELQEKLSASEFLNATRPAAVAFYPRSSHLYLYLSKRQANQVSGIIGLNTEADGQTTLNGDFQLNLLNTFDRGESFRLQWRSPTTAVQDFQIDFSYPYLLGSPLGISLDLALFRQDSSFIKRQFQIGLNYRLAYQAYFDLRSRYRSSNALGAGSDQFSALGDYENIGLELGFRLNRLDQRIVAKNGYQVQLNLGSASRQAQGENWQQYSWEAQAAYYKQFAGRLVWHQDLRSTGLGGSPLFENELERLGGIRSLRGFNELSLFSNAYALARNELRYMLGPFDYLCLFLDGAYTQRNVLEEKQEDWHSGWGAGLNFQTNGGIFSLFLAVGQSNAAPYDFRSTKVHLSYVNTF